MAPRVGLRAGARRCYRVMAPIRVTGNDAAVTQGVSQWVASAASGAPPGLGLDIRLRDRTVRLGPGELFVVPKGVEHCPAASEEAHLLLIEPTGTPNTGDAKTAAPRKVI